VKKYLEDLENELKKKLKANEIEEILADHEEMIRTALEEGLDEDKIVEQFGEPKKVAEALGEVTDDKTDTEDAQEEDAKKKTFKTLATFAAGEEPVEFRIELANDDVTYKKAEGDSLRVSVRGNADTEEYTLAFKDNKFVLSSPKKSGFDFLSFGKNHVDFLIEIPAGLAIKNFFHKSLNGDIMMETIKTKAFELSTVNGDVRLRDTSVGEARLHTVNGDFDIKDLQADFFKVSLVSGDMRIKGACVKEDFHVSTVSGDVRIEDAESAGCILHSVSGDIEGKEFYPDRVALKSVSGDIRLQNKEDRDIRVEAKKTVSGRIKIRQEEG